MAAQYNIVNIICSMNLTCSSNPPYDTLCKSYIAQRVSGPIFQVVVSLSAEWFASDTLPTKVMM